MVCYVPPDLNIQPIEYIKGRQNPHQSSLGYEAIVQPWLQSVIDFMGRSPRECLVSCWYLQVEVCNPVCDLNPNHISNPSSKSYP